MKQKNIGLTSIPLLIFVIIVGINIYVAKAKALGVEGMWGRTASVTSLSLQGRLGVLEKQVLVADLKKVDALQDKVLNVDVDGLSCASSNLMNN